MRAHACAAAEGNVQLLLVQLLGGTPQVELKGVAVALGGQVGLQVLQAPLSHLGAAHETPVIDACGAYHHSIS